MINWIPVNDSIRALPEPFERVLVLSEPDPEVASTFEATDLDRMDVDWLEPFPTADDRHELFFAANKGTVTHWARLSELGIP